MTKIHIKKEAHIQEPNATELFFDLWETRLSSVFKNVHQGDILYLYCSQKKSLLYKMKISSQVIKKQAPSEQDKIDILKHHFNQAPSSSKYFQEGKDKKWLLAFTAELLEDISNKAHREIVFTQKDQAFRGWKVNVEDPFLTADDLIYEIERVVKPERKEVLRSILERQGQPQFRTALLKAYSSKCAISGADAEQALEAAHIFPHADGGDPTVSNGILLRSDLHTLFDRNLIAIEPNTHLIWVSSKLKNTCYQKFHHQALTLPSDISHHPHSEHLKARWEEFNT